MSPLWLRAWRCTPLAEQIQAIVAFLSQVPAHKMVLAACSPYFYAMFTGFTERESSRVTLQGLDPEALQTLVDYVYTSLVEVERNMRKAPFKLCNT